MKTPFHEFCLRTGVLCQDCKKMISDGKLSRTDFEISKFLLTKYADQLGDIEFVKSYESKKFVLVKLGTKSLANISGAVEDIASEISKLVGKEVFLFETGEPLRSVVQKFFYPAKIESIRKSWLPDGSAVTTIKLSGKIEKDIIEISELLSSVYDTTINIYA